MCDKAADLCMSICLCITCRTLCITSWLSRNGCPNSWTLSTSTSFCQGQHTRRPGLHAQLKTYSARHRSQCVSGYGQDWPLHVGPCCGPCSLLGQPKHSCDQKLCLLTAPLLQAAKLLGDWKHSCGSVASRKFCIAATIITV